MLTGILSFLGILAVVAVGIVFYRAQGTEQTADRRTEFLQALTRFVEGRIEPLEGFENSFRIAFRYEGIPFSYEDIEEKIITACQYSGVLKCPVKTDLKLSFSEKPRGSIKVNLESVHDVASGWVKYDNMILLPKPLKEFDAYTNSRALAEKLLADEELVNLLVRFKSVDKRGRPVMSLNMGGGELILRFHPPGNLNPQRLELLQNASAIDAWLDRMLAITKRIDRILPEDEDTDKTKGTS